MRNASMTTSLLRSLVAAIACAAALVVALDPALAMADPLSQTFTAPGQFFLKAPPYAVRAQITVQGASGADGSASALGTNPGGTGGLGTVITGQVNVVGGESLGGFVGAAGGELPGAAGDGAGGRGGAGGQFTMLGGAGSGDLPGLSRRGPGRWRRGRRWWRVLRPSRRERR